MSIPPEPFDDSTKGDESMRYALLICDSESRWNAMSEQKKGQLYHEQMTFTANPLPPMGGEGI